MSDKKSNSQKVLITAIPAGFPSPATDFIEKTLDLNEMVVSHSAATYFVQVQGHSMTGVGINTGDILVVDRSLDAHDGSVVVAVIDGEFTVKTMAHKNGNMELHAENEKYKPIIIREGMEVEIWGVVTYVVHKVSEKR